MENKILNNSTKKRGRIKFVLIPFVLVLVAVATFMLLPANISRQEAQEIAVSHIGGGRTNRADRDFERFQRVWYVEVFYEGFVHSVYVSMRTGEVVKVEMDRWD